MPPTDEDVTLGEVARSQGRLESALHEIQADIKLFTQAGVVRRLDEVEERLRWYGRWLLGILAMLVVTGLVTFFAASAR